MAATMERWHYWSLMTLLFACILALCMQVGFLYISDITRFPVNTVKIAANFQRITRQQIEDVLSSFQSKSYFTLSPSRLRKDLLKLDWADKVEVNKIWPDLLTIKLVEKEPIAYWNDSLMTTDGRIFNIHSDQQNLELPILNGPQIQKDEVLQIYQKLSKLLFNYSLQIAFLKLYENQSWDLSLTNGVTIHLGKQGIEKRLERFCKAYRGVFNDKSDLIASVDLRYEKGMAVMWKQQKER